MLDNSLSLAYLLATGTGLGFGAVGALKAVKNYRSNSTANLRQHNAFGDTETAAAIKKGKSRSTNCLSLLSDGCVRLRDGNLVRGFWVEPHTSLWSSYAEVDNLFDELGGLLRANLPIGTGFQFRYALHPDDSDYLEELKRDLINKEDVHPMAQALRLDQLDFYSWMSERGYFHRSRLTLWIYLPMKHAGENSRNPFTEAFRSIKDLPSSGLKAFKQPGGTRGIVRRTVEEETEVLKRAEESFAEIESMCPLDTQRLDRDETWQALYYNYNENATSCPAPPSSPLIDLSPVLCSSENVRAAGNWYMLHGNTPVTMITLFVPPESDGIKRRGCYAGMMRHLSNNSDLRGRYTILPEYITEEKEKTEAGLKRDKWALGALSTRPSGKKSPSKKKQKAHDEIDEIEEELVSGAENLVKMRFRILVYGAASTTSEDLETSVKELDKLCKKLIKYARKKWRGADIAIEDELALRDLYEGTLLGNMELRGATGRELKEQSYSYCAFIPGEDAWKGMPAPHTIKRTFTNKRFGINFWRNPLTKSPLVCVLGASGTGKSVEIGTYVMDVLAEMAKARVKIVDFGETYAALCEVLGGIQQRFDPNEHKTINIWDYKGLEIGEPPDLPQVNLVVDDASILLGFDPDSDIGQIRMAVLNTAVIEVYKDFVPRNRQRSGRRHEPTLSDLTHKLRYFPFETAAETKEAEQMASILKTFEKNPWLDAKTHDDFRRETPLEVFELESLHLFPKAVQKSLAFRVGSRVIRSIGEKIVDQITKEESFTKTLLVFDEMHEYNKPEQPELKVIFRAMEKGARKGRKTNVITILGTHGYQDLAELHGLTKNAGVFVIGKQDEVKLLSETRRWTEEVEKAVLGLKSSPGEYAQFVVNVGMGSDQRTELIVSELSGEVLWTLTSDANERNARETVKRYFPHFTAYERIKWLANLYRHGLTYAGLEKIDPIHLPPLPALPPPVEYQPRPATAADYQITTAIDFGGEPEILMPGDSAARAELLEMSEDELDGVLSNIN